MAKRRKKKKQEDELSIHDFDIRKIGNEDWETLKDVYIESVNSIVVPEDLKSRDILRVNAEVDEVYAQARFDFATTKAKKEYFEQRLSNARKTSRLIFKKQKGQTNEDREAVITQFLEAHPVSGDKEPLYTLVERWKERFTFMEAVIDNLSKKSDKMISGNGALKLDAQGRGDTRD